MKTHFLLTVSLFSLFFLSTITQVFAKDEMQGINGAIEIESLDPDDLLRKLPVAKDNKLDTFITVTKSSDGTKGFLFSLSSLLIDYGEFTPTNPITRTNTISIKNTATQSYSLFIYKNHPLITNDGSQIPDTTCDNGACTTVRSAPWINTLSFGFGYRCDNISGDDCVNDFEAKNAYKQIATSSNSHQMIDILYGKKNTEVKEAIISYKVNTAASQPPGIYTNMLTYIAVPGY